MPHRLRARGNRLDDIVIARAAAEIAFELVPDRELVETIAFAINDVDGGHDHARRAEAALQTVMLAEGFLHRVQRAPVRQTFDSRDLRALALHGEDGAGLHGFAVEVDDASAALARVATDVGAGEPQVLAK